MKAKVALAFLLIVALGTGVWYFTRPQGIDAHLPPLPSGTETSPVPVSADELLQPRKPLADSVVFPGVKLGDSLAHLKNVLEHKHIQFKVYGRMDWLSHVLSYDVKARLYSASDSTTLSITAGMKDDEVSGFMLDASSNTEAQARKIYQAWVARVSRMTGMKGATSTIDDNPTTQWEDQDVGIFTFYVKNAPTNQWITHLTIGKRKSPSTKLLGD